MNSASMASMTAGSVTGSPMAPYPLMQDAGAATALGAVEHWSVRLVALRSQWVLSTNRVR